jgi:hypothetical protein
LSDGALIGLVEVGIIAAFFATIWLYIRFYQEP